MMKFTFTFNIPNIPEDKEREIHEEMSANITEYVKREIAYQKEKLRSYYEL